MMELTIRRIFVCSCLVLSSGCVTTGWWPSARNEGPSMPLANSAPMPVPGANAQPSAWNKMVSSMREAMSPQPRTREARRPNASPVDAQIAMARLMERRGETANATKFYRSLIDQHGPHPRILHRLGVLAAQDARLQEAEELMAAAYRQMPNDAELMNDLAYALYLQDRLSESESLLRRVLVVDPGNKRAQNNLGLALGMQGRMDESLTAFRQAAPSQAEALANQAYVFAQMGDLQSAQDSYSRALNVDQSLRTAGEALVQVDRARKIQRLAEFAQSDRPLTRDDQIEVHKLRTSLAKSADISHLQLPLPARESRATDPVATVSHQTVAPQIAAEKGVASRPQTTKPGDLLVQQPSSQPQRTIPVVNSLTDHSSKTIVPRKSAAPRPEAIRAATPTSTAGALANEPARIKQAHQDLVESQVAKTRVQETSPSIYQPEGVHVSLSSGHGSAVRPAVASQPAMTWKPTMRAVGYEAPTKLRVTDRE